MTSRTLSVLVENKPGVLSRISGLFSRRGFNIDSLAVGPTEHSDVSRVTIATDVEDTVLEQLTKQLNKLVEVLKIVELDPDSIRRELVLVKVQADESNRGQVLEIIQLFKATSVDVSSDTITIEATGNPEKLISLLEMLEPYGVRELVQSGLVALGRGSRSIIDRSRKSERGKPENAADRQKAIRAI